jgi:DNA-binding transcriptional regulator YhcF (GntR family)
MAIKKMLTAKVHWTHLVKGQQTSFNDGTYYKTYTYLTRKGIVQITAYQFINPEKERINEVQFETILNETTFVMTVDGPLMELSMKNQATRFLNKILKENGKATV